MVTAKDVIKKALGYVGTEADPPGNVWFELQSGKNTGYIAAYFNGKVKVL